MTSNFQSEKPAQAHTVFQTERRSDVPSFSLKNPAVQELSQHPIWVVWAYEERENGQGEVKRTKVPYQPRAPRRGARSNDAQSWASFDLACLVAQRHGFDGVGFNVHGTGYLGLDFDWKSWSGEGIPPQVQSLIDRADSYAEVTPSGRGARVILRGQLPQGCRHKVRLGEDVDLEAYSSGRFFTLTGQALTGAGIEERQQFVDELAGTLLAPEPTRPKVAPASPSDLVLSLSDADLWRRMEASKSGPAIAALRAGDLSAQGGDHSSADFALCGHLAFWTNGDARRMDALHRQTALTRPKWDQVHHSDGATYGARTIERVLARWDGQGYTPQTERPASQAAPQGNLWADHQEAVMEQGLMVLEHAQAHHRTRTPLIDLWAIVSELALTNLQQHAGQWVIHTGGLANLRALGATGRDADISARLRYLSDLGFFQGITKVDPTDKFSPLLIKVPEDPRALPVMTYSREGSKSLTLTPNTYAYRVGQKKTQMMGTDVRPNFTTKDPHCDSPSSREVTPTSGLRAARWTAHHLARRGTASVALLARERNVRPETIRRHLRTLEALGLAANDRGVWEAHLPADEMADLVRLERENDASLRERIGQVLDRTLRFAAGTSFWARHQLPSLKRRGLRRERSRVVALARLDRLSAGESLGSVFGRVA